MEHVVSHMELGPLPVRRTRLAVPWLPGLAVFLLALLPRILNLSAMITPDERRWVERAVAFFAGLVQHDWAATFQTGHPGVTTMWTGTLGLLGQYLQSRSDLTILQYLSQVTTRPSVTLEYLLPARLPTAVLTALCVVAVYLLLRRLFSELPALLAAVLLALDPFFLAHSRVIHHDALATSFSLVALIAFLGYVWRHQHFLWLVLSAVSAGLAFLSKGSALFLIGFMGLVLLWAMWADIRRQPHAWRQVLAGRVGVGLVWFVIAALVFIAFWPAMWVDPLGTVAGMMDKAVGYAQEAHTKGNYFMGQPVADPGPLFYPLVLLFRTTPLTLLGLALFLVQLVLYVRRYGFSAVVDSAGVQVQISLLLYVVIFTLFMGFGSKKFDRYLLPVIPVVDILAGIAIAQAMCWLTERRAAPEIKGASVASNTRQGIAVVLAVLVMQGLASLPQHPYYLSAYNALVGGPWLAQRILLVGWGEGLEQAAFYLNEQPDVQDTSVSLFYYRDFVTFFAGQTQKLEDDNPDNPVPWQGADYVVFYVNQVQRQIPDEATVGYFQSLPPEFAFERNGIPYVQVYRAPEIVPDALLPGEHIQRAELDGKLELASYTLHAEPVEQGKIALDLYWRAAVELSDDYEVTIAVENASGDVLGRTGGLLYAGGQPASQWPGNRLMRTPFEVAVDGDTTALPGRYFVRLRVSPGEHEIVLEQTPESQG